MLSSATAVISTTMVLTLVGTIVFFATLADSLGRSVRENFTVEVLLDDSLNHQQTYVLQQFLRAQPYTRHVGYTSKDKATRLQNEALDIDPEEFLGYSPIPASFEVYLHADYADADSLARYMPALRKEKGVMDVVYPKDLMDRVNENFRRVSLVLLIVAALLGTVSLALINNTMRMSIARRKQSIQTMKLVGAKWSFIRRPFLGQALRIGIWASLLADGLLAGGMYALTTWDADIARLLSPAVTIATLGAVPAVGISLTLLCAYFSVNKHLGMTRQEAALY